MVDHPKCDMRESVDLSGTLSRSHLEAWTDADFRAHIPAVRKTVSALATLTAERDELAKKLAEAVEWRPIETAPKDGTRVLLSNEWGVWVGYYLARYQSGFVPDNPWQSLMMNHQHMPDVQSLIPDGWLPLPATRIVEGQ